MSAPHYSMRERAALRLYAAFLDVTIDRLPELFKSRISDNALEAWLRVLDVAGGVRDLRKPDPRPDEFAHPAVKVKPKPVPKVVRTIVAPPPAPNAMVWCDQCDRRVTNAEAKACRSLYCKATVA